MKITYNITGSARKEFANAIAHLMGAESVYQGPPSFAYDVGGYIVDKNGNLETPEGATTDDIFRLVDALYAEYEYKPEESLSELFPDEADSPEEPEAEADDAPENGAETAEAPTVEDDIEEAVEAPENGDDAPDTGEEAAEGDAADTTEDTEEESGDTADAEEPDDSDETKLTFSLPREKFSPGAIERLKALVASKQTLLKKVFDAEELPIVLTDDQIQFPWFTLQNVDGEIDAYAKFIHAIAMRALTSSRISSTEKPTDNDKFTMRLFLNNLGFKGEEYKFARRFLIRNLEGNGAWRHGNAPDGSGFDLDLPTVVTPMVNTPEPVEPTLAAESEKEPEDDDVGNDEEESEDEE